MGREGFPKSGTIGFRVYRVLGLGAILWVPIIRITISLGIYRGPLFRETTKSRFRYRMMTGYPGEAPLNWVAVEELNSSYYIGGTLFFIIYTHYGNFI